VQPAKKSIKRDRRKPAITPSDRRLEPPADVLDDEPTAAPALPAAALALPPVLFFRTVSRVVAKRRHRSELVRSLPLLAVFVVSWALGEMVGYVAGPGDSLAKVC